MRPCHTCLGLIATLLLSLPATAEVELTPVAGYRMGGEFDVNNRTDNEDRRVDLEDSVSQGLLLNVDLSEPGKQLEFYLGRQETTARSSEGLLTPTRTSVDLTITQLQFGGLYFPGGTTTGGFVSGVAGVTRLDPKPSGLDTHHRASLSLGGGYKWPLNDHLRLRLDLRGLYTVLDSGGAVFCSGGCNVRFESNGFFQVEASAGLVVRF
ncbi:hypothetical protein [Marinobacter sp. M-5]|jgi:hypothetical protein|uniref:hypothetical protein n=1 Tax=Marinobacter sp. M-5 TaxID=3081089 RepID=UPI00293C5070|nr:hypothetical protein [Marinobacter sp. M-5]MDV3504948.1 hypothetical protein [Marinobacter sp. M-5]